jgi:hypothetical protein
VSTKWANRSGFPITSALSLTLPTTYGASGTRSVTQLQAIYAIKWALEHADDELILQANDYDQSIGRVFNARGEALRPEQYQGKSSRRYHRVSQP